MNPTIPVLNAQQIATLLPQLDVQSALKRVFTALSNGQAVQPPQQLVLLPDGRGDFINYFGVDMSRQQLGVKISPYLLAGSEPRVTAWTLLMSTISGQPLLLCDAGQLTTERTAATTALAVDLLARPDARVLSVIGSGAVARAHIRHALALRDWQAVRVWSRNPSCSQQALAAELGIADGRLTLCATRDEATAGADVLMLCTSSATPVVDPADLTQPCLITSISTNAPGAHEIPPAALAAMDVYCDYRATTPLQAGEMVLAARDGWLTNAIRGDLPELLSGQAIKPAWQQHVFFRSIGLGLEDLAIADSVLTYLNQQQLQEQ